jgi:hypothetical protein
MQEGLRPAREWFFAALRYVRQGLTPDEYLFWYVSLWAQVSFYTGAREAILTRAGQKRYDEELLQAAAEHVVHVMLKQLEE